MCHIKSFSKSNNKLSCCFQPQLASLCATSTRGRPASCHRPVPPQETPLQQEVDSEPQDNLPVVSSSSSSGSSGGGGGGGGIVPAARSAAGEDGSRSSTDSPSVGSVGDTGRITNMTVLSLLSLFNKRQLIRDP